MINIREYLEKARKEQGSLYLDSEAIDTDIKTLTEETQRLAKVKKVLSQSAIHGRDTVKRSIESIVTEGLNLVQDKEMSFEITDVIQHNKPGALFKLKKGNKSANVFCYGGGIRNILSTILRFIFSEFSMPKLTTPLVLDEVGNNLSARYLASFGNLLSSLSRKFNRQVILITHQPVVAAYADKIIRVTNNEGRSEISYETNTPNGVS